MSNSTVLNCIKIYSLYNSFIDHFFRFHDVYVILSLHRYLLPPHLLISQTLSESLRLTRCELECSRRSVTVGKVVFANGNIIQEPQNILCTAVRRLICDSSASKALLEIDKRVNHIHILRGRSYERLWC